MTREESTTTELVELTRQAFEANDRRDLDAMMRLYAPDAVMRGLGILEGRSAIRAFVEDYARNWEELEHRPEEVVDEGNRIVLAVIVQTGRPVGSASRAQQREAWVFEWEGRLIARLSFFVNVDKGRAVAERLAHERR